MQQKPRRRGRRSIRLPGHDYAGLGHYFVTICTHDRSCLFGDVVNDEMVLNDHGLIAEREWRKSADIRSEIEIDRFVVMPNHLHGLVFFQKDSSSVPNERTSHQRPKQSLGSFIAGYKSTVTKAINTLRSSPGVTVWQRNYWEHIVRTDRALNAIRRYIEQNPVRWSLDRYHPNPSGTDSMATEVWKLLKESVREDGGRTVVRPYDGSRK